MDDTSERCTAHVQCPFCGYDLFGLATDRHIVCCPECGNRADIQRLQIRCAERAKNVRGAERPPLLTALWSLTIVVWELALGILWNVSRQAPKEAMSSVKWASLAATPVLIWIVLITAYVRRYHSVTGAISALIVFHVTVWSLATGAALCFFGPWPLLVGQIAPALMMITVGPAMLVLGWWLNVRTRRILYRMHDQVAARTAAPVSEPKP